MLKKICGVLVLGLLVIPTVGWGAVSSSGVLSQALKAANFESSLRPEVRRVVPIDTGLRLGSGGSARERQSTKATSEFAVIQAASLGPNLIVNPSVETAGSSGLPQGWFKGGYGTNTRTLTYPVAGFNSTRGLEATITSYASGDAKWYFADVPVTPGKTYQFSDYYFSNVPSTLTLRYKMTNGTFTYPTLVTLPTAANYTLASTQFTVPANVQSVTIFHLIKQVGELVTDEFALQEVQQESGGNLISNSGFEISSGGLPTGWIRGGWGTNNRTFLYPVTGAGGGKAAQVSISSYTSGDAKWAFNPVSVERGIYTYSNQYYSNATTYLTAQLEDQSGALTYKDLAIIPPASSFTPLSIDLSVPLNVRKVTVFHLLKSTGQLTIDNVSLIFKSGPQGIFLTGGVTLSFDDMWLSQYQNALPKLNTAGLKGTFYVVTRQLADYGFPGYMSIAQVQEIYADGHELGAHTRTHRDLVSLSNAEQQNEIQGSYDDLLSMDVGPIKSFAYPFGSYNQTTLNILNAVGFESGRTTIGGNVQPTSPELELPRMAVEIDTTFAEVKQRIDQATANKEWLILVFHQINSGSDRYTTTPQIFNQIIDYLDTQSIPVVTISEGVQSLDS